MRLPIFPTLFVAVACATMIALGLWQLDRRTEKEAQLALYRANLNQPAIAYPLQAPVPDAALFRPSSAECAAVAAWRTEAGRSDKGVSGYRWIAECRAAVGGASLLVDMGVSRDPTRKPNWAGGPVSGIITTEPSHESLLSRLGGEPVVLRAMLVSATPAPGLEASARPSPDSVPNNHLAYAGQWFFFAGVAAIIYLLAVRRRMRAA